MSGRASSAAEIADLLLQLGRAAYADCANRGLTQAQWIALRFFARANRFSRTVSGFAQFHGTTKGTASQTIKSLAQQGYLSRARSESDGRSIRFDTTAKAGRKLREDPLEDLARAVATLDATGRDNMTRDLRGIHETMIARREASASGFCHLCGHRGAGQDGEFAHCRLMNESLSADEGDQLCVRFKPAG